MTRPKKYTHLVTYGVPIMLAGLVKVLVWSPAVTPFNADEAVVALMARHINQGHLMAFFYGQYYMGSLDAILTALLFKFLGEQVWVIRLLQSILYLGTVVTTIMIAKRALRSNRGAFYAGLLVAVPSVNAVLYTTVSLGGYGEMLLIGNLLLLGGIAIIERLDQAGSESGMKHYSGLFLWGFGAGFSFWVLGLSLVYVFPVLILMGWKIRTSGWQNIFFTAAALIIGGVIGSSPWWVTALTKGNLAVISELFGGAIVGANQNHWLLQPLNRLFNLVVFGGTVIAGLRPPWGIEWLMLPLLPFALIFWIAALVQGISSAISKKTTGFMVVALLGLTLSVGFLFSPYGDDPSGRYFLPLILPMAIFGADLAVNRLGNRKLAEIGLIMFIVVFNLGGIIQSRSANPPGLTTQFDPAARVDHRYTDQLLEFLTAKDITRGYTNYWVAYPLAFLSREEIIFSPKLPYHPDFRYTSRDDRYPEYTDLVSNAQDIAYITTRHPELDEYIRQQFLNKGIQWQQTIIGDYTVYYRLSSPVYVDQIGLGETTDP